VTERISVDPNVHFGKPYITGTRIPVQSALELLGEGLTFADIIRDYHPDITAEDIPAAILHSDEQ